MCSINIPFPENPTKMYAIENFSRRKYFFENVCNEWSVFLDTKIMVLLVHN